MGFSLQSFSRIRQPHHLPMAGAHLPLHQRFVRCRSSHGNRRARLLGLAPPPRFATPEPTVRSVPGPVLSWDSVPWGLSSGERWNRPPGSSSHALERSRGEPPERPALRSLTRSADSASPQDGAASPYELLAPSLGSGAYSVATPGLMVSPPAQGALPPLARHLWTRLGLPAHKGPPPPGEFGCRVQSHLEPPMYGPTFGSSQGSVGSGCL
jgi:hypothetical protein